MTFAVEDVDGAFDELKRRRIEPFNEPHDRPGWGIHCFHFRDTDGNLIEVNKEIGMEEGKEAPRKFSRHLRYPICLESRLVA